MTIVAKPMTARAANSSESKPYDRCQTPDWASDPLFQYIDKKTTIWMPAAGDGFLRAAWNRAGYPNIIHNDILTGANFFEYTPDQAWDMIIENPPGSDKYNWLQRCYELGKPFALLMPHTTMASGRAHKLFEKYGPPDILIPNTRIDFKMPKKSWTGKSTDRREKNARTGKTQRVGGAQIHHNWYCWHVLFPTNLFQSRITYITLEPRVQPETVDELL